MKKKKFALIIFSIIGFLACDDSIDDEPGQSENESVVTGSLNIAFDNKVGDDDLILTTKNSNDVVISSGTYTNASQENYEVEELKYIISNIVLIKDNGEKFEYPKEESYFIIDEADKPSLTINLTNIPVGNYSALEYGFGVDQSKYPLEGANFVPKANEKDMIWSWTTGFKFIMFEGTFKSSTDTEKKSFLYHIGSIGDQQDNYKIVSLKLKNSIKVTEDNAAQIEVVTDVNKFFNASNVISISAKPEVQADKENSPKLAANAVAMFSLK